jgi:lipopolysaccharide transport system permease protein
MSTSTAGRVADTTHSKYQVRIRASQTWLDFDLAGLWEFRDLFFLLVRRDFVVKYKQTILGPLWFLIQPLLTTAVFTIIFSRVAGLSTDGAPPVLFYLAGTTIWNYVSQTVNVTGNTFSFNEHIFTRVFFPRLVVPVAVACSNLLALGVQLITLLGFTIYYKIQGNPFEPRIILGLCLVPLLILQSVVLSLACGLFLSAITAKYRDLTHILPFLLQLWMYASPVIYSASHIPEGFRWIVYLNPVASIIENFKSLFLGTPPASFQEMLCSILMTLFFLFVGLILFRRTERTFADVV